jgi:hypothetical protein
MKPKDKQWRKQFMFETNGHVAAIESINSKLVTLLPTTYNPASTNTVHRRNKAHSPTEVFCSTMLPTYNLIMKGVGQFRRHYLGGHIQSNALNISFIFTPTWPMPMFSDAGR